MPTPQPRPSAAPSASGLGSSVARWLARMLCAALLIMQGTAFAQKEVLQALDALDELQSLAYRDNARALTVLRARAAEFEPSPSQAVQRTYLGALIGAEFGAGHAEQALTLTERLRTLSQQRQDDVGMVLASGAKAHWLASQGKTADARRLVDEMAPLAERSGDPEALWTARLMLGSLQNTAGEFEPALTNVLASMDHARARPRQSQTSLLRSQVQLGLVYMSMKNAEKALSAIDEGLVLARRLGASQTEGALQLNRGNVESGMGRLDVALEAYRAAFVTGSASGLVGLEAAALNNMGDIHLLRKQYAQAEPVMRRAMDRYQAAGDGNGAALARANLGFALMGQGQVAAGVAEVKAGLAFLREAGARTVEEIVLDELARMYEQAGMYREAVETGRAQKALSRDLFRIDREQTVAALQAQFDATQRQRQIEALARENSLKDAELHSRRQQQLVTATGAALLLIGGGVVLWLYRQTRQANRDLIVAKQLADTALNEKNLFLATASHDLRQPVHAMSMMVEAIGLRNHQPALVPLLRDLKSSMTAMNQLFNALLDLSKLEAGKLPTRAVPVSLPRLLGDVAQMFREQASASGLTLRLRLPRRDAVVQADPTLLRQALVNLTHNAIRYTQQGKVLIGVRRRGADWVVEVWDTGIGIAAAEQQRVFSPYFRSEQAWHMDGAGHGLGLAVVARCARQMGATCGFQSRFGQGSRFWLRLAAGHRPDGAAQSDAEPGPADTPEPLAPLAGRCLVLDDDLQVLGAWKAMLEGWGVDARFATTAGGALAHVERGFEPAAIFCDQRLRSGESGYAVLQQLLAACPGASGAMVSGELDSAELAQAEDEGYLVLRKPLDLAALHAVLEHWFARTAQAGRIGETPVTPAQCMSPST